MKYLKVCKVGNSDGSCPHNIVTLKDKVGNSYEVFWNVLEDKEPSNLKLDDIKEAKYIEKKVKAGDVV